LVELLTCLKIYFKNQIKLSGSVKIRVTLC